MTSQSTKFSSRYSPIKKLGEGGYGTVWLVQRHSDKTVHAAKIIPDEKCKRKTWCAKRGVWIIDEIVLSETLHHVNVVKLEEVYYEREMWILVMEFLPHFVDLFDHIADTGPMSADDSRNLVTQVLAAANYLISRGIDHRDIKDENILYNPYTKQIKLIDFGSASLIPSGPYTAFQGTEVYLPPEFHTHGSYAALQGTTWAVGCLAYVLLNGESPFSTTEEVVECKTLNFKNGGLDQLSKEFLRDLLVIDEDDRLLPEEVAFHPWLTSNNMQ